MTDNFAPELGMLDLNAIPVSGRRQPLKRRPPAARFIPSSTLLHLAADALGLQAEGLQKLLGLGPTRFGWIWDSAAKLSGQESSRLAWLLIFKFDGYNFDDLAPSGIDWDSTMAQITEQRS